MMTQQCDDAALVLQRAWRTQWRFYQTHKILKRFSQTFNTVACASALTPCGEGPSLLGWNQWKYTPDVFARVNGLMTRLIAITTLQNQWEDSYEDEEEQGEHDQGVEENDIVSLVFHTRFFWFLIPIATRPETLFHNPHYRCEKALIRAADQLLAAWNRIIATKNKQYDMRPFWGLLFAYQMRFKEWNLAHNEKGIRFCQNRLRGLYAAKAMLQAHRVKTFRKSIEDLDAKITMLRQHMVRFDKDQKQNVLELFDRDRNRGAMLDPIRRNNMQKDSEKGYYYEEWWLTDAELVFETLMDKGAARAGVDAEALHYENIAENSKRYLLHSAFKEPETSFLLFDLQVEEDEDCSSYERLLVVVKELYDKMQRALPRPEEWVARWHLKIPHSLQGFTSDAAERLGGIELCLPETTIEIFVYNLQECLARALKLDIVQELKARRRFLVDAPDHLLLQRLKELFTEEHHKTLDVDKKNKQWLAKADFKYEIAVALLVRDGLQHAQVSEQSDKQNERSEDENDRIEKQSERSERSEDENERTNKQSERSERSDDEKDRIEKQSERSEDEKERIEKQSERSERNEDEKERTDKQRSNKEEGGFLGILNRKRITRLHAEYHALIRWNIVMMLLVQNNKQPLILKSLSLAYFVAHEDSAVLITELGLPPTLANSMLQRHTSQVYQTLDRRLCAALSGKPLQQPFMVGDVAKLVDETQKMAALHWAAYGAHFLS